jgi:AMMECR1 domain-containing protein
MKAGLLPDCWLEQDTKIYVFEAIVYAEDKPKGEVKRLRLADHQ